MRKKDERAKDMLYIAFSHLSESEKEQFLLDNADVLTDDDVLSIYEDRELGQRESNFYGNYE